MWSHLRVCVKIVRAEGLSKSDAIVVVSNGGVHLEQLPSPPDGPLSFKNATRASAGSNPSWDESFLFPAVLGRESQCDRISANSERALVFHVKHLAVGKKWTNNNEGEWLGKATVSLSEVVGRGAEGMVAVLPILKKNTRVGSSVLHVFVAASAISSQAFVDDLANYHVAAPAFSPLTIVDVALGGHTPCWRCLATQPVLDAKGGFAMVHVGLDYVVIQYAATPKRGPTSIRLSKEEILGSQRDAQGYVSIYVLTVPSEASPEKGKSSLLVYILSAFQDAAHAPLQDIPSAAAAHACSDAIACVSRVCAPLNRRVLASERKDVTVYIRSTC